MSKRNQPQTIYVHIGYPKTGTTSIQSYLTRNKEYIKESGYHYIHSTKFDKSLEIPLIVAPEKCRYFVKQLKNRKVFNPGYRRIITDNIKEEIENGKSIIISNEALIARFDKIEYIDSLKSLLSRFKIPIKIIVYLRRQDEFVSSMYSTQLRTGEFRPIMREYKESTLPVYRYLDYCQLLSDWGDVFGKENLIIKIYDKDKLQHGDIIADFMSVLNIHVDENEIKQKPIKANQAFGKNKILFLEQMYIEVIKSILAQDENKPQKKIVDKKILKKLIPILESIPNGEKYSLPYENRTKIIDQYKESNIKLGEKYLGLSESPFKEIHSSDSDSIENTKISIEDSFTLFGKILLKAFN